MSESKQLDRIRLNLLVDQFGAGGGGGTFTTGFVCELLRDPESMQHIERLSLVASQGEVLSAIGQLPHSVRLVRRRFPSRLRGTVLERMVRPFLPRAQVAHGMFYYAFPGQGRQTVITLHDLSFFRSEFHPAAYRKCQVNTLITTLRRCQAVALISDSMLAEFWKNWPDFAGRVVRIYQGVAAPDMPAPLEWQADFKGGKPLILLVGTVEPRKNYARALDAFEYLLREEGVGAPDMAIVGRSGWMSDTVISRMLALEGSGRFRWVRDADNAALAGLYRRATVFSYLSLYEGFGYPPLEAALAGVPMVLSNASAVGEIWGEHACCVDPGDVGGIVKGWKWALGLEGAGRREVIARQLRRAREFTWTRCVREYVGLYRELAGAS